MLCATVYCLAYCSRTSWVSRVLTLAFPLSNAYNTLLLLLTHLAGAFSPLITFTALINSSIPGGLVSSSGSICLCGCRKLRIPYFVSSSVNDDMPFSPANPSVRLILKTAMNRWWFIHASSFHRPSAIANKFCFLRKVLRYTLWKAPKCYTLWY